MSRIQSYINILFIVLLFSCNGNRKESELKEGRLYKYEYYENGKIKLSTPFLKNDIKDGIQNKFYPSGKIEMAISWINNKRIGEAIDYYSTGKVKSYKFYNLENSIAYQRDYDSTGVIIHEIGEIFPLSITDVVKFNRDSVLDVDIYIIQPPNTDVTLNLFLLNKKDTLEIPFRRNGNFIHLNERVPTINQFNEFAIKQFIRDFDQNKQWEQTNILNLHSLPYSNEVGHVLK